MSEERLFFVREAFNLKGRVAVITGGAGLLGLRHCQAVAEFGGIPIAVDLDESRAEAAAVSIRTTFNVDAAGYCADITDPDAVKVLKNMVLDRFGKVDILINNAANNPKVGGENDTSAHWSRLEKFPLEIWNQDIAVGLTGAFICAQTFGAEMAKAGNGVILNIASDLGLIAPDQRIYRKEDRNEEQQSVKPVTYSVVKAGLIGLTRYLATYWLGTVRANALAPGGVYVDQDDEFVQKLTNLIPMGRMANIDEYKAAVAFLISDASSYMNGAVMSVDGGRTAW